MTKTEKIVGGIIIVLCIFAGLSMYKCNQTLKTVNRTIDTVEDVSGAVKSTSEKVKEKGGFKQLIIEAGKEVKDIKKQINED